MGIRTVRGIETQADRRSASLIRASGDACSAESAGSRLESTDPLPLEESAAGAEFHAIWSAGSMSTRRAMNYSIWAILASYAVSIMPGLGESMARCFPVMATRRRDRNEIPVTVRTTLRAVAEVLRAFTAYGPGRSSFALAGSPLILPDISARVSERIFFPLSLYAKPGAAYRAAASAGIPAATIPRELMP